MIDLNKIINDSLTKIEAEDYVQEIVEKRVKDTLKSIIDSCLSSYSPFGKSLEEEISARLNINLDQLNIAEYNTLVLNAVKEKLEQVITVHGIEKINEAMNEMLANVKPEYKLSEIIEAIKEAESDSKGYGDEITLFIGPKDTRGYLDIYIDADNQDRKYSCNYKIRLKDEGIAWNITTGDREFDKNREFGAMFGIEAMLFKIYATNAKVVLDYGTDPDDYDLYYREED